MEILAIYVEEFGCFKKTLIPFSSEYEIKLERLGRNHFEYTIHQNKDYFNIFEPKINSLTGIIGENGSGKTTIAKILRVIGSYSTPSSTLIYFYKYNGRIYIKNYLGDKLIERSHQVILKQGKGSSIEVDKKYLNENINLFNETNTKLVYYSSLLSGHNELVFDYNSHKEQHNLINLSIDHELRKSLDKKNIIGSDDSGDFFDPFSGYYWQKLNKILDFLMYLYDPYNGDLYLELSKYMRVPREIYIKIPNTIGTYIEKIVKRFDITPKKNILKHLYNKILNQKSNINEQLSFSYIIALLESDIVKKIVNFKEFSDYINNIQLDISFDSFAESIHNELKKYNLKDEVILKYQNLIIELENQNIKTEDIVFKIDILAVSYTTFSFFRAAKDLSEILKFNIVNFRWGYFLSSGEEAILNQFASYHSKLSEYHGSNNIFVIDEGELYFHPRWQQSYLNLLIIFFNYIKEKNKNQLIITSNSPFLVSDIPKDNLIFLQREGDICSIKKGPFELTFGANIHSLFHDAFFLDDTFIGKFAEERILELIDKVKNQRDTHKNLQRQIDIIGEPFLKMKLTELNKRSK